MVHIYKKDQARVLDGDELLYKFSAPSRGMREAGGWSSVESTKLRAVKSLSVWRMYPPVDDRSVTKVYIDA